MKNKKAKITLVGAGPGDKDLITLKGLKAIQSADAILYDALVNEELLDEAPQDAIKVFVGKRAGTPCIKQDKINMMLVQHALEFGHVVRLKGGDPFIFGRGHEELVYAESFDIHVNIVPGISSVTSVPLLQQVPLTRRNVSESFWVLTGSTKNHQLSKDIIAAAKTTATMVILMGIRKLPIIRDILLNEGKGDLPIMLIQSGSTKNEKIAIGTVDSILSKAEEKQIGTPGIIIIGEVVRLHPKFIKEKVTALCQS